MGAEKTTVNDIRDRKQSGPKITMLTAYTFPVASLIDRSGIDIILVGDSLANVLLGLESTKGVKMQEMIYHSQAVTRAVKSALVVGDMPYESYQVDPSKSVDNAKRFINEAGCDAVKVEWFEQCLEVTTSVVKSGISVMGHIGLTPQTADKLGGFKVQGKSALAAQGLIQQALDLERAGCFAIVLECVPSKVAEMITARLSIPTIGIGAGSGCDGQVLVTYDLLGLFERFRPKFVKQYVDLSSQIRKAVENYKSEVISGEFPAKEHEFTITDEEFKKISQ